MTFLGLALVFDILVLHASFVLHHSYLKPYIDETLHTLLHVAPFRCRNLNALTNVLCQGMSFATVPMPFCDQMQAAGIIDRLLLAAAGTRAVRCFDGRRLLCVTFFV